MRVQLTLENLKELDSGKVQVAFAKELQRCLLDCINRPNDKKSRKTTLEVSVVPKALEGQCEGVFVAFDVSSKIPPRKTDAYPLGITTAGQAFFSVGSEKELNPK